MRQLFGNAALCLSRKLRRDLVADEFQTRYPPTDEVFFVQNAGAPAAGTGLNKSSIILKIALSEAAAVSSQRNATGAVKLHTVDSNPQVKNPNGWYRHVQTARSRLTISLQGLPTTRAKLYSPQKGRDRMLPLNSLLVRNSARYKLNHSCVVEEFVRNDD